VDFSKFVSSPTGTTFHLTVPVQEVKDWSKFIADPSVAHVFAMLGVEPSNLLTQQSWTLVLLENLKPKVKGIKFKDLRWVLRTAMPLTSGFHLYLNREVIESSKGDYTPVVSFTLAELPKERIAALSQGTGEIWQISNSILVSTSFPSGVSGQIIVTAKTLRTGKSSDLARSHGFFIRVRDRLINDGDPLFGLVPLVHGTFDRFHADISADDLDTALKASRETIEESSVKNNFRSLLREIFNEANSRYTAWLNDAIKKHKESDRSTVPPRLVAYPIADALIGSTSEGDGAEADNSWFYVQLPLQADISAVAQKFYSETHKYRYNYTHNGATNRLVKFDPNTNIFWLNEDHELVAEYLDDAKGQTLLEDIVTAEALLEVYLRDIHITPHIIGEVLERRDALLRSLVRDHIYSPAMVATSLREAKANEAELEIALVVAARTLGFVASHISGAGEPDGIARFVDYPGGEKVITLEAKSSASVPSLGAIDFAGLTEHMERQTPKANGCLLVAPSYPGAGRDDDSAAAHRAHQQRVSCWTVDQLADFVEQAETRQLNARSLLDIVLNAFSPDEVTAAIASLFSKSPYEDSALYRAILQALRSLEGRMRDKQRNVSMVWTKLTDRDDFKNIDEATLVSALTTLAGASNGGMTMRDDRIIVHVVLDELERRLAPLTKASGEPRSTSGFRDYDKS